MIEKTIGNKKNYLAIMISIIVNNSEMSCLICLSYGISQSWL